MTKTKTVEEMWFVSARKAHTSITKLLRGKDAQQLTVVLGNMVDRYWELFCDVHDKDLDCKDRIQSWHYFQAHACILREYGWWNDKTNQPKNWSVEGEANEINT